MSGGVEAELKFLIQREDLAALAAAPAVADMADGEATTERLVSTYYDTADQRLRKAMASIRVRRTGGGFEQTVKIGGDLASGLAERAEINVAVDDMTVDPARLPDGETAETLRALLGDSPLEPLFTVDVERTTRLLRTRAGDLVEFVLDDGTVVAGETRAPVLEAEFELKDGDIRGLFEAARAVMTAVPVRLSTRPKSERGFDLVDGVVAANAAPVRAEEPEIAGDEAVEVALRRILRSCVVQITANIPAVAEGTDPEGPHQLRVGLRRLRSALTLFKPVIAPAPRARLNAEVKWLGSEVGALRDLDVLIEEIVAPLSDRVNVKPLLQLLEARRTAARERLLADLAGPRTGALVIDLVAFTEGRGWLSPSDIDQSTALVEPIGDYAQRAVHERWRKVARKGRHADRLDEEERHDLRKSFKKLRYTLDFLGPQLGRKDGRKLMKDVKAAQEVLGYLNDVHTAEVMADSIWSDATVRKRKDYPAIERAIGFCLGWHGARAEREWTEAKALVSLDPDEA